MKLHIISTFFFIGGISSGVFAVLMMNDSEKVFAVDYFNRYLTLTISKEATSSQVFLHSAFNNLSLLLIICVAGFFMKGFIFSCGAMAYKGLVLGFSVALILESMQIKGALLVLLSVVPQNLIFIPILLTAVAFSSEKRNGSVLNSYIFKFLILTTLILLGCLIEAFLAPVLTRLII